MSTSLGTPNRLRNHSTRDGATPEQSAAINKHLSEFQREMLTLPAQIVYCTIRHLLKDRNAESIWLGDAEISRRARVLIGYIAPAQIELAKAGLLHMVPGQNQTRYELITDEASQ